MQAKADGTHFRLDNSSSISISLDFWRTWSLKFGRRVVNRSSSSDVDKGSEFCLRTAARACLMIASSSSRLSLSLSSDSA